MIPRTRLAEAPGRHGLSLPLRTAVYRWFDRWLAGGKGDETTTELPVDLSSKFELPRMVLCGRRDAALVACFAAALEPRIYGVAGEEMPLSFLPLFEAAGTAINAASFLPGLLQSFGDIPEVLGQIAPRKVLIAAGLGDRPARLPAITDQKEPFTKQPRLLLDWLSLG